MDNEPYGFGGWLVLLLVIYCVITPLAELATSYDLLAGATAANLRPAIADWSTFQAAYTALIVLELGLLWSMGYRLMRVFAPSTIRFALVVIWLNALVMPPLGVLLVSFFADLPAGRMMGAAFAQSPFELIRPVFWAIVWTAYFNKSRRVENSYYDHIDRSGIEQVFE